MSMTKDLSDIIQDYINDFNEKKGLSYVVKTMPIVWFGDIEKYRESELKIVTVGLNPSDKEFSEPRFTVPAALNCDDLYANNNNYFKDNPYEWFRPYEKILSSNFDSSYGGRMAGYRRYKNTSIHIDAYTAIATTPVWGLLPQGQKDRIANSKLFKRLLKYLSPDIVLFSANREVFTDIFGNYTLRCEYKNIEKASYIRTYDNHGTRPVVLWGRNHGIPFAHMNEWEIRDAIDEIKRKGIL